MKAVWCVAPTPGLAWAADGQVSAWSWWQLDGDHVVSHGQGTSAQLLAALPTQTPVHWLLWPDSLSWHRIQWPKVSARQTPAVLRGLMEDRLLDDAAHVHLALAPGPTAGPRWALASAQAPLLKNIPWLREQGHEVARLVPLWAPSLSDEAEPRWFAHVHDGHLTLCWTGSDRVLNWHLPSAQAGLLRDWLPKPLVHGEVSPEAMAVLEAAWGPMDSDWQARVVHVADWLHEAASRPWDATQGMWRVQTPWRRRAEQALREGVMGPKGRPWRRGLGLLALVNALGLQVAVWQTDRTVAYWQAQQVALLKQTLPATSVVLNPEKQMQRAWETAQGGAQRQTPADLATVLTALQGIWPADVHLASLSYEDARQFRLVVNGATPALKTQAQRELQALGWRLDGSTTEWIGTRP